jgi:hypothetical protein
MSQFFAPATDVADRKECNVKKIITAVLCIAMVLASTVSAFADGTTAPVGKTGAAVTYYCPQFPAPLQPESVIEYIDDSHVRVLKGGFLPGVIDSYVADPGTYDESPVRGMVVTYAVDGYISHLKYPDGLGAPVPALEADSRPFSRQLYSAYEFDASSASSGWKLMATWGAHNNKLYKDGAKIKGTGRATVFIDAQGQYGPNRKGSVATSLKYDNCSKNKPIKLTMKKKAGGNHTRTMSKTDAGGLPDAVIDVWNTGVEYWGYKYSSSLSINNVKYTHS